MLSFLEKFALIPKSINLQYKCNGFITCWNLLLFSFSINAVLLQRSLSVLIDKSVKMIAIIQKRTVTLHSGHPLSSK